MGSRDSFPTLLASQTTPFLLTRFPSNLFEIEVLTHAAHIVSDHGSCPAAFGLRVCGIGSRFDANAALKYWQAFATLPVFTDAENQKIGNCLTTPLDDPARNILSNSEYSLTMMHRGAAFRTVSGASTFEEGVYARLPHADPGPGAEFLGLLASPNAL